MGWWMSCLAGVTMLLLTTYRFNPLIYPGACLLASCQTASLLLGPRPGSGSQSAAWPTSASNSKSTVLPAPFSALESAVLQTPGSVSTSATRPTSGRVPLSAPRPTAADVLQPIIFCNQIIILYRVT